MKPQHPVSVLIIRPDAMGDLVLFSPTLLALRKQWPAAKIRVLIRSAYKEIAQLLIPNIDWLYTDIDPFSVNPLSVKDEINNLKRLVAQAAPDLIVAACPRRNWIDMVIASAAPEVRHVAFLSKERDPYFGLQLKWAMHAGDTMEYKEIAPPFEADADWKRMYGLADYLTGTINPQIAPQLALGPQALQAADHVLNQNNLKPGQYLVCAAAGSAHVTIKGWSLEKYADVVNRLKDSPAPTVLLIGHSSEKQSLEKVKALCPKVDVKLWVGNEGELGILAALIAQAKLYLGNDTGAMHLAAALNIPSVAIFGGGTWPRFKPEVKQGISLINPLPCFGCGWDCPFGDAPCVKAIPEADVTQAVLDLLADGKINGNELRELSIYPAFVKEMMGHYSSEAKERSALHLKREQTLIETAMLASEKDSEIEMLKKETDKKDVEIGMLKREADKKDVEITMLKQQTDVKQAEIEMLKKETDKKDVEMKMFKLETDTKDIEIELLKKDTDLKLKEILFLSEQTKEKDAALLEIHHAHCDRLKDIAGFLKSLEEKEVMITTLAKTCEDRLSLIVQLEEDLKQHKALLQRRA